MNAAAPIFVGKLPNGVVWIRVEGKGSFQNSPELKEFTAHMAHQGTTEFVVDLENCPVMDSTFMGTLVGIVCRDGSNGEAPTLEVINANGRNVQLLQSLGLDHVFDLDLEGKSYGDLRQKVAAQVGSSDQLNHVDLGKRDNTEHVLEAHETLAKADPDNVPRFRDVIEFLKKELENTSSA